jgi:hypothetical protein
MILKNGFSAGNFLFFTWMRRGFNGRDIWKKTGKTGDTPQGR